MDGATVFMSEAGARYDPIKEAAMFPIMRRLRSGAGHAGQTARFLRRRHSLSDGRDHDEKGYTLRLAGAGVIKPGFSYGATEDPGFKPLEKVTTIYDLRARILHLRNLEHEWLIH